jgi:hypothetical protein
LKGAGAVVLTLALGLAHSGAAASTGPHPVTGRGDTGAVASAHDCVPRSAAERGDARVAWKQLENPVFALDHMTKDQTIRLVDGAWHLFFSENLGAAPESTRTGHWVGTDLDEWSAAPPAGQWDSPDLTRATDGSYVLAHQLPDPANAELRKIFASTATDLAGPWSEPARLVPGLFEGERIIDAALAHTSRGLFLIFKRGLHQSTEQHDELAWSPSGSLDGPWEYLGEPDLPWSENFQFLPIDGKWHVLVTTIPVHRPALYRLVGDPSDPQAWLRWKRVRVFDVPEEAWNRGRTPGITHETANSAYLCDARRLDGYWYLFYAGSTELQTFDGRGHAKIGVARSKDLERWKVPPKPKQPLGTG